MKQHFVLITLVSLLVVGCTSETTVIGPEGPQGPQGPQGIPGESGILFEYENVDFVAPDYSLFLTYPGNFVGLPTDNVLVYFLWEVQEVGGQFLEVWRPLPIQRILPEGLLFYQYDFTKNDTRLFLETTFPAGFLTPVETDDWIVRVVIVPANFGNGRKQWDNLNILLEELKIKAPAISQEKLKKYERREH